MLSLALALTVTLPDTVLLLAGAVIDTVGNVVSGGCGLATWKAMAETASEVRHESTSVRSPGWRRSASRGPGRGRRVGAAGPVTRQFRRRGTDHVTESEDEGRHAARRLRGDSSRLCGVRRFLVAFSLAGEQRELVRAIAEEVERMLGTGSVFLDDWFEYYIAGDDADLRLQNV
jgi:hypothetical protein